MISRLQTKTGEVYALGQLWPGAEPTADNDPNQLKVGPIFLLPGEEAPEYDYDDEGEPTGDITATFSQPPRYEVWCVTDRVLSIMMAQLHGHQVPEEELAYIHQGNVGMTRRTLYLDTVAAVDEDWPAAKAFVRLVDRFIDLGRADEEEQEARDAEREERQQEYQEQLASQSNGGRAVTPPQTGG